MGRKCKDYTNTIHGCWKVIERDFNPNTRSHETFWKCKCLNCGNEISVRKTDLDKNPQSCNKCKWIIHEAVSSHRSWKIGDVYGKLTIIGEGTSKSNHTYVTVQCECGSDPFEVRLEHLKGQGQRGRTISCGCTKESSGELKIRNLLESINVNFQTQYRIKDKNNQIMIFDFVILNTNNQIISCIEYNGEQHYYPIDFFGGEKAFKNQQIRDNRKINYCKKNNIKLLLIPYWEYDNIDINMLLPYLDF